MELEFKPDFAAAQLQWQSFWEGRNRAHVAAVIPKPGAQPVDKPEYTSGRDGQFQPVIDQFLRYCQTHEFLGAAIPFFYLEFAADHFSALLGTELRFREDGHGYGWTVPWVEDWDDADIRFHREGFWWERTVRFVEMLRAAGDGRFLVCAPTLVANLDALSAMRGPEKLLWDLMERPEAVKRALERVTLARQEVLDALAEALDFPTYGSINRHGMYSRGRINLPQIDFSCMIGPAMFAEFCAPYLRRECASLDASEYHLDGPDAIKHLEALCRIPELHIIQWVHGSGRGEEQDWTWLFQKIDALGKGQILGGSPARIKQLRQLLRSNKIYYTAGVASREEYERLIADL